MGDVNFSGRIAGMTFPSFSKAKSITPDVYVGGIFFAWDNEKYNQTLVSIFDSWVNHYVSLLKDLISDTTKQIRKDERWRNKIHERANELRKKTLSFFSGKEVMDIGKVPMKPIIKGKSRKSRLIGRDRTRFTAYLGYPSREGELSFYYIDVNFTKEILELNRALTNKEISEVDYREKLGELKQIAIKELLKDVLRFSKGEVKEFFELLLKLIDESKEDVIAKKTLERMLKIEIDFGIGSSFDSEDVEGNIEVFKPVLTKVGYFPSPLTFKEALIKLGKNLQEEIGEIKDEEELVEEVKELLDELGALEFFEKLYTDKDFLKEVRNTFARLLKEKSEKVKSISFSREKKTLFEGTKNIYSQGKYVPLILYESSNLRKAIYEFVSYRFMKPQPDKYLFLNELIDGSRIFGDKLSFFFPSWEYLVEYERKRKERGKNPDLYEGEPEILVFLLSFGAFFTALKIINQELEVKLLPFFFLNIENRSFGEENGYYYFWQLARAYLDYIYPYPSQTITKETLASLKETFILKNAFISALKGDRKVILKNENGIGINSKTTLFLLVENKSVKLYDTVPHYLYSLFKVVVTEEGISIEKEEKNFFIFAGGQSGELKELEDFLDKNNSVVLLQSFSSPIAELKSKKMWKVIFKEFKTPILMEKTKGKDKSAFLIWENMFREGIRPIAFLRYKEFADNYELLVVRAPLEVPKPLEREPYISLSLALFFIEKKKDDKLPVVYSLLSWLSWGSESFKFSYAKPKFLPLKLPRLRLHSKETLHTIPLGAALIELGYVASELYGKPTNRII